MPPAPQEIEILPSAARTASGNSGELARNFALNNGMRAYLIVTAMSGTSPSLTVHLEDSIDGTNWTNVASFPAVTTPGVHVLNITSKNARRMRVRWDLTGTTPSATFSVHAIV